MIPSQLIVPSQSIAAIGSRGTSSKYRAEVRHRPVVVLLSETVTCASEAFTATLLVDCSLLVDLHRPLLLSEAAEHRQRIVPKLVTVQLLSCCRVTDSAEASSINAYVGCW